MEEEDIDYVFKLLDIPWWYYAIAGILVVVIFRGWKKLSLGLLVGYSFLLIAETILIRKPFIGLHFQPELFWSWKVWSAQRNQIFLNVMIFIPIGLLVGYLWKWKGLWVAAGLSIAIEVLQLLTSRGLCEIDDVVHNMIGAVIGTVFLMIKMEK